MRKIYLSLLALVCTVGAWAQETSISDVSKLSNTKVYYLKSERGNLVYNADNANQLCSTKAYSSISTTSDAAKWAVYNYKEKYYLYSIAGGKFVCGSTSGAFPLNAEVGDPVTIVESGSTKGYPFAFSFNGTGSIDCYNHATVPGVAYWGDGLAHKSDDGTAHMIIEAGELDLETQTLIESKLDVPLTLAEARGIIADSDTKIVGKEKYTDVASLRTALGNYDKETTAEKFSALKTALSELKKNGTKETVTLSPGDKFVLKCIEDARGYLVYSTVEGKGSETEPWVAGGFNPNNLQSYSAQPDDVDADGVYKEWTYVTVDGKNYLFNVQKKMSVATTGGEPVVFANRGTAFELISGIDGVSNIKMGSSYLASAASWNGNHPVRKTGMDNGARFYIEKVGISVEDALLSEMTLAATYGSVDEWKNDQLAVLGYVGGYAKSEQSNIESIINFAGIETFVKNHQIVEPVNGGYYFVQTAKNQNAGQGAYLSYTGTDCRVYPLGEGEKPGIQHVWQFNAPTDGGFKLMSCNLSTYLQTGVAPAASTIAADMDNGYKYTLTINAGAETTIKDDNDKVLRTETNNVVNQWTSGSTNMNTEATWYIIPAEDIYVTLSAEDTKGAWATAYLPFGVNLPAENLKAYAVTATENGSATLTEVTNIPANQGVILNGKVGEHHLTINKNAAWSGVDNKLRGTNVSTSVSEAAYVLAKPETEVGLYKAATTDGAWTNNGNKAYLPANEVAAGAPFLIFDFGTETAIEGVAAKDAGKTVIYDLSGRRVESAQKGIFIINGKKVIK